MRVALRKRGDVIAKKATTIAIVNQKGGTAKTTTCENLGIGLAMEGKKVLLVDVDPQGSLTISMGWQQPDELSTTLSTLMQKAMNDQPIQPGDGILHHAEGVDLIPANIELAGMEVALVNSMNREKMLKQVLDSAKREYDYILLDCTPSLGMLTINALAAADTTLNAKGQQTVHFMNLVDEADLLALMEEEDAEAYNAEKEAVKQAELDKLKAEEEAKKAAEEAEKAADVPKENKMTKYAAAFLGVVALIALAAGGGFYFFIQQKNKKQAEKEAIDPDADYTEDTGDFEIPPEDDSEDEDTSEEQDVTPI